MYLCKVAFSACVLSLLAFAQTRPTLVEPGGTNYPFPFGGGVTVYVLPEFVAPIVENQVPVLQVPNDPGMLGFSVFYQALLFNPDVFSNDPLKMSQGLEFVIGGTASTYGTGSGLWVHPLNPVLMPGDTIDWTFGIE